MSDFTSTDALLRDIPQRIKLEEPLDGCDASTTSIKSSTESEVPAG